MPRAFTPEQWAAHLLRLAAEAPAKEYLGRTLVGENALWHIRQVFGDNAKLADLATSTQEERVRLGFTPNDPLRRSGALRDTVRIEHEPSEVAVGSDDPKMQWLEWGTPHIPPRPAIAIGAAEASRENTAIDVAVAMAVAGDDRPLAALEAVVRASKAAAG